MCRLQLSRLPKRTYALVDSAGFATHFMRMLRWLVLQNWHTNQAAQTTTGFSIFLSTAIIRDRDTASRHYKHCSSSSKIILSNAGQFNLPYIQRTKGPSVYTLPQAFNQRGMNAGGNRSPISCY